MVSRIVALKAPKEAALYFDEVLPFDFGANAILHILRDEDSDPFGYEKLEIPLSDFDLSVDVIKSLGRGNPAVDNVYREHLLRYTWILFATIYSNTDDKSRRDQLLYSKEHEPIRRLIEGSGENLSSILKQISKGSFKRAKYLAKVDNHILGLINKAGFGGAPYWYTDELDPLENLSDDNGGHDYALTLRGLKLVDPEKISWRKLIEFRKDEESMKRLRDFRVLFHDELKDKPRSYVEDRIMQGLENHERAAKDWSFNLVERSFSIVGSKENLLSSALAIMTSATCGAPIPLIAASGLAYSVVGSSIEVTKVVRERAKSLSSAYGYLSNLRKLEYS